MIIENLLCALPSSLMCGLVDSIVNIESGGSRAAQQVSGPGISLR